MKIKLLPDSVINKIAAGEVVDRPSAIVRELLDNSIDSGASSIKINIENGGSTLVRIVDNGSGMSKDDALLAFERHATSKISNSNDLFSLQTRGFRGEALASIASVSKVTIRTKDEDSELGTEIILEGGKIRSVKDISSQVGTDITVRSLFYNVPARKSFLRSDGVESARCKLTVIRNALSAKHTEVIFIQDNKETITFEKNTDLIQRSKNFLKGNFVTINGEEDGISITGLVGHPSLAETSIDSFIILVNGRPVYDKTILRAVKEGFQSTLKDREIPVGIISLLIPTNDIDINVHPQKSEIRFSDLGRVLNAVRNTVTNSVNEFKGPANYIKPRENEVREPNLKYKESSQQNYQPQTLTFFRDNKNLATYKTEIPQKNHEKLYVKYIGKILDCYLLFQDKETLITIDMHAAHERINYNKIRDSFKKREVSSQQLLVPQVVDLSFDLLENIKEVIPTLEQFGFVVEITEDVVVVKAAPTILKASHISSIIKEIADYGPIGAPTSVIEEKIDHIAARLACHASIRSGESITEDEAYSLFDELADTEFGGACPHGRPAVVYFSKDNIESWFGRDR